MNIMNYEFTPGIHLITLSGPITISQAGAVTQCFRNIAEQGIKRVVVNLEAVPFIDSRGLAALITGYQIFGSKPQNFRLAGPQDQLKVLFELTGFVNIFQIFESVAEVMAAEPGSQPQPVAVLETA